MNSIPFTNNGYNHLKEKLKDEILKRPEILQSLKRAREMGDLSENGLYKAARLELSAIDRQIRFLKNLIKYGKVSTPNDNNTIKFGHFVTVEYNLKQKTYQIVGEYETNPKEDKISFASPIGKELIGKAVNARIKVITPKGIVEYKIISIE